MHWTQNASSASQSDSDPHYQSTGGLRGHAAPPPPFASMPFNMSSLPPDFANIFMNMAANSNRGQHPQNRQGDDASVDGFDDPGIRIGGNINLNFGEEMPEELTGTLRSLMDMFSGAASHGDAGDATDGRSAPG